VDTTFPTNDMLYWADYTENQLQSFYGEITYLRAMSAFKNVNIFGSNGETSLSLVDDIDQRELGDCYYLSGLSGVGEYPSRL
jgi:hypothetical protein